MSYNLIECYGNSHPKFNSNYYQNFECIYELIDNAKIYYEKEIVPILNESKGITINGVFFPNSEELPDKLPEPLQKEN